MAPESFPPDPGATGAFLELSLILKHGAGKGQAGFFPAFAAVGFIQQLENF